MPATDPSRSTSREPEPTPSSRKRGIEALADSVSNSLTKKKKYVIFSTLLLRLYIIFRKEPATPYASAGRWIPRVFGPWINIKTVFLVGLDQEAHGEPTGTEDSEEATAREEILSELFALVYLILILIKTGT